MVLVDFASDTALIITGVAGRDCGTVPEAAGSVDPHGNEPSH